MGQKEVQNIGMLGMQELFFCWGGDIVVLMEYYVS